jgi:hypothetical protein
MDDLQGWPRQALRSIERLQRAAVAALPRKPRLAPEVLERMAPTPVSERGGAD